MAKIKNIFKFLTKFAKVTVNLRKIELRMIETEENSNLFQNDTSYFNIIWFQNITVNSLFRKIIGGFL